MVKKAAARKGVPTRGKKKDAKRATSSSGNDHSKLVAALSYLFVGIIWYFLDKSVQKDSFVKFHVGQGLVLLIFSIVWNILLNILMNVSYLYGIIDVLSFVPLIFAILGMINAFNGKKAMLPLIGEYSSKINL